MRRASLAPVPAGGEGGGAASNGVSRLQMPQVVTVLARPPLAAGPSDGTATHTPVAADAATARVDAHAASDPRHEDEPMGPVVSRARPPVSPGPAAATRKEGSVQVAVRVRPLLPKEIATRVRTCVESEGNMIHIPSSDKTFTFDHVFPMEAHQKDLYDQVVQPLMDSFLQGYNVTVLAYGQTGSGKTYTMGNDSSSGALAPRLFHRGRSDQTDEGGLSATSEIEDREGVIPRFINEMFERLEDDKETTTNQVSVSFLEIYGEDIHDLLDQSRGLSRDSLQIRESNGSVWVQGLTEVKVSSFTEAAEQMRQGCLRRITGSTGMNEHSSRSHAVYTVKLVRKTKKNTSSEPTGTAESGIVPASKRRGSRRLSPGPGSHLAQDLLDDDDSETIIVSKLTFVDLAGSERLKKTQAEGDRMKEGIQINVGLLALGNVITALGDERRRSNPRQHVAYRDSKLTRLLQDALGGNSRTLFIACISPAESNTGETINTLQYASRAKNIQNKAVKNVDPRSAELTRSKVLNDVLRSALTKALSIVTGGPDTVDLLADPTVADILRRLEEVAWAIANGSKTSAEATMETSRALAALVARRSTLVSGDSYAVPLQEPPSSQITDVLSTSESITSYMNGMPSDSGSSIHLDHKFGPSACTSLRQVCRVLEVISLALEMQELKDSLSKARASLETETTRLSLELKQKYALIQANEDAVSKMETWGAPSELRMSDLARQESRAQAMLRLQHLKQDTDCLERKKSQLASTFEEMFAGIQSELKQKEITLRKARQSGDAADTPESSSPLDLMLQIDEIKDRFHLSDLYDAAWALESDEIECCELLDDQPESLAFKPKFFPNEDFGQSERLVSDIFRDIEDAISVEDLHSSQSKRLRERATILQRIVSGWARDTRSLTEDEFLAANEEDLRLCEENIQEISAALRYRGRSSSTVGFKIDAIESLDLAKSVIKRLVDAVYGHKRVDLIRSRLGIDDEKATVSSNVEDSISKLKQQHAKDIDDMRAKFTEDLVAAYETVKPFALQSFNNETESLYARRQADAKTIACLEEQAMASNAEMQRTKQSMHELQSQVESMKSQFEQLKEYAALREECAQLAKELGLPVEDFAGIAAMINPLAIKEAREIRETLLAKKAEKLERIEVELTRVKSLEAVLKTSEPLNIEIIRSNHERILDDQLLAISFQHTKLVDQLSQRIDSQVRVLDSIATISAELEVTRIEDLRHAHSNLLAGDLPRALGMLATRGIWKQVRASSDLAIAVSEMLSQEVSLHEALSAECLELNGRVLKALLLEKAKRLAEVEEMANEVRSLIDAMEYSEDDVRSTLLALKSREVVPKAHSARSIDDQVQSIFRKAGQLDTSQHALHHLTAVHEILVDVRDSRLNALAYLYSVVDEAEKVAQESLASSGLQDVFAPRSSDGNQNEITENICNQEGLRLAVERFKTLSDPADRAIRALLFASNDQFSAYGIETSAQRMSFFLGSEDTIDNPNRKLLERYLCDSSNVKVAEDGSDTHPEHADCLLSDMDPSYSEFAHFFSPSYGAKRVSQLKESACEIRQVSEIVMSAQARLKSLQKIMTDFNAVMAMKKEIAEFAVNASNKDRLFGSSTVLMKEEKKRKRFAREYPLKLARLRDEVQKWVENESGEYDLNILGEEMKGLLLDMLNTDTNLMHLDLGVIDTSRQSARRASKTAAGISVTSLAPGTNTQPSHPNQESPANPPRVRPSSALARDGSGRKRTGAE